MALISAEANPSFYLPLLIVVYCCRGRWAIALIDANLLSSLFVAFLRRGHWAIALMPTTLSHIQPQIYVCWRVRISLVSSVTLPLYPEGCLGRIGFIGQITSYHPTIFERFAGQHIVFTSPGPMTAMMKSWARTLSQDNKGAICILPWFFAHTLGWYPGEITLPDGITPVPQMHLLFELS